MWWEAMRNGLLVGLSLGCAANGVMWLRNRRTARELDAALATARSMSRRDPFWLVNEGDRVPAERGYVR